MKILVLVKQVPDKEQHFDVDPATHTIKEEGLSFVINEFDRYAVEEALKLRDDAGGEVVLLSVGPDRVRESLRKGLAMGADRAIKIDDPALAGSDAFGLSRAIARAVEKEGGFDLILAGITSEDRNHTATGVTLAERLGLVHATVVVKVELCEGGVHVERELEGGTLEPVKLPLPALLTIQTGINEPRYPTLPGIRKAQKKEIKELDLAGLELPADQVGFAGRQTEILALFAPEKGQGARIIEGDVDDACEELIRILKEEEKILS